MDVSAFDFDLPEECIALRPVAPRDRARLLVIEGASGALADKIVRDLPDLLRPGDVLVGNDTKVVPARLLGTRLRQGEAGAVHRAAVDLLLHTRLDAARWRAFARPAKRLKPGDAVEFGAVDDAMRLSAAVRAVAEGGQVDLAFSAAGEALDAALAEIGLLPLPPYIAGKRPPDAADRADYQTVFAREAGAIAAPTAGLHLTPELIGRLAARGIGFETLTLHVGPGTFLPVKAEDTRAHVMHAERGLLSAATAARLNAARAAGGRIVALGTTALRLLESAATPEGRIDAFDGETAIFITPGYRFRAVDGVMTNFHLPRSTLFMLVSAFCGLATMRAAYAHAIAAGYRFYSYGDASLLWPAPESLIAR